MQIGTVFLEGSLTMCSVSLENIQSLDLGILLLGSYPEEIFGDADSDLCARVLIAALFI